MSQTIQPPGSLGADDDAATLDLRAVKITALICAAIVVLIALLFGNIVTKVGVIVIALTVAQGYWRGASETAALALGLLAALLLAVPLGRGLEGVVAAIAGTTGLLNRMISVAALGLIVLLIVGIGSRFAIRAFLKRRESWLRYDRITGAGVGLIEGVLIAALLVWVPQALEPIAAAQVAGQSSALSPDEPARRNPVAERVVAFAESARASVFGGAVEWANPLRDLRMLTLANDFVLVMGDEAARERFLEADAIKRIRDLPSVQRAIAIFESDAQLMSMIERDELTAGAILQIMSSPAVLDIFDNTTVVRDIGPLAPEIERALTEAREHVGRSTGPARLHRR